jgi:hypothetical protein
MILVCDVSPEDMEVLTEAGQRYTEDPCAVAVRWLRAGQSGTGNGSRYVEAAYTHRTAMLVAAELGVSVPNAKGRLYKVARECGRLGKQNPGIAADMACVMSVLLSTQQGKSVVVSPDCMMPGEAEEIARRQEYEKWLEGK